MSTGFISTMRVTHATPANLYANSPSRLWESDNDLPNDAKDCKDQALQFVEFQGKIGDGIEVVLSGGRNAFLPNDMTDYEEVNTTGKRLDGRNLIDEWVAKRPDSKFVWNKKQLDALDVEKTKHVLGVFDYSVMKYEVDRANDTAGQPSLPEMVEFTIKKLKKNPKGFFLMVESGLVDYGHHANDAHHALTEALVLDASVTKAKELTNEDDTLVIVTADHGHTMSIAGYPDTGNPILGLVKQGGVLQLAGNDKMPYTTLGYQNGPSAHFGPRKNLTDVDTQAVGFKQQSLYDGPEGFETHGGQDVGIYSRGPWADLLVGVLEENVIFHVMDHALCLSDSKQSKCNKPEARGGKPPVSSANSSCEFMYVGMLMALLSAAANVIIL